MPLQIIGGQEIQVVAQIPQIAVVRDVLIAQVGIEIWQRRGAVTDIERTTIAFIAPVVRQVLQADLP
jgi:hypothetical protein